MCMNRRPLVSSQVSACETKVQPEFNVELLVLSSLWFSVLRWHLKQANACRAPSRYEDSRGTAEKLFVYELQHSSIIVSKTRQSV